MNARAPRVLTIGGVDPCGGAGITADARMIASRGCVPLTVAASLTVQNRHRFDGDEPVRDEMLCASLAAVAADGPVAAVKLGWIAAPGSIDVITAWLAGLSALPPIVLDPVIGATAGGARVATRAVLVRELVDRCARFGPVVTPNLPEAAIVAPRGAEELLARGCTAVLVKGGHGDESQIVDRLFTREQSTDIVHPRLPGGPIHGTGCALSSALACHLALGTALVAATRAAIADVERCIAATPRAGDGLPVALRIL